MGAQIGPLHVRRSTFIRATPERVWQEIGSFGAFGAWFGLGHELHVYEPRLDGRVDLSAELDGQRQHYGGRILVFDAPHEVTFEVNWEDPAYAWPVPTLWTIRLTSLYDGTMVEILHHGFERLAADAGRQLEGDEEGWDVKHLKALRSIVER